MHYVINKVVEKFPQITIDNYHEVSHYGRTILREENIIELHKYVFYGWISE